MDIHPQIVLFGGSLVAILFLAGLTWLLKLGGNPALVGDDDVARAAGEVEDGFAPQRIAIGRGGTTALARDPEGRIMVIKRHGNKFAGRVLTGDSSVREEVDALIVDPGDARFGSVRLSIDGPAYWADAINRL